MVVYADVSLVFLCVQLYVYLQTHESQRITHAPRKLNGTLPKWAIPRVSTTEYDEHNCINTSEHSDCSYQRTRGSYGTLKNSLNITRTNQEIFARNRQNNTNKHFRMLLYTLK